MSNGAGLLLAVLLLTGWASGGTAEARSDGLLEPERPTKQEPAQLTLAGPRRAPEMPAGREPVRLVLEPGQTLLGAFDEAGVPYAEAFGAAAALEPLLDPRALVAGQEMRAYVTRWADGKKLHLARLTLVPETDRKVVVEHGPEESFSAREETVSHSTRVASVAGEISASLYEAALGQGVPRTVLLQVYRVLGHAVDFQRELQPGDRFSLGYELHDDGQDGGTHAGVLTHATLNLSGRLLGLYRYKTGDGYTGFFDADGRSVETSLMKTPVDGGRLSSAFGRRKHPVLGYTRMHKGLDFAAPRGTPVLAAGDGVVVRRSRYGSFGNYIRIRHDGTYSTAYAHLNRYAKGLEKGDRVRQGDVIGYVGATGLATGPNLHYEVLRKGVPANPRKLDLPPRRVLTGAELARFRQATARFEAAIDPAAASDSWADSADAEVADGTSR